MSILSHIVSAPDVAQKMLEPVVGSNAQAARQSSYFIARILIDFVDWIMKILGIGHDSNAFLWIYTIVVLLFSFAVGLIIQSIVVFILRKTKRFIKATIYNHLLDRKFFTKIFRIIPPIILLILLQFTLYMHSSLSSWITRLSCIYIVYIVARAFCIIADVVWDTVNERENTRKLPLKGVVQVVKLIIWIISIIIMAAILFNKSPGALLAGLGAFAAVLMLIFKDSILGIVAGVQLAQNDSLHVGDWISVPNGQANGIVDEVSLTDVKIINWDKTISTVPPYTLISGGFKNFRNMQESGTRRIQRSYMIDADSVVETTDDLLKQLSDIPLMKDWIAKKQAQQAAGKVENVKNSEGLADGCLETNLGMFRAYLTMYLTNNPHIDKNSDLFVTTLEQTATGIPLQLYCFTSTSSWIPYEGIMAEIFEHLAVMMRKFNLYLFENPTGRDTILEGYFGTGKSPAPIFGIPYPFFNNSGTPSQPGLPPQGLY